MAYVVAIDSGGTFTDCVVVDERGRATTAKAPSTPRDFSIGVLESVSRAAEELKTSVKELLGNTTVFSHGTTVATNALLTRSGGKVGLITTKGHEDAIIIGRTFQKVAGLSDAEITYVVKLDKADPIVPRPLIKGVTERVDYKGEVIVPLNYQEAEKAIAELARAKVGAIAVCLLWSFMNPKHEQEIARMIAEKHPGIFVTISYDLAPVIKEYERSATAVINAYLSQVTGSYLAALEKRLKDSGLRPSPIIMQSSGGVTTAEDARTKAVTLLASGPAGGVMGAVALGKTLGYTDIVTTDVGGTSFDVGLVVKGEPQFSAAPVFAKYHILTPVIDVQSIGAGGGSIAWIEPSTNLLRVGPQSAGADPGPVCYDAGGTEPTVTDADLILNRINPDFFLGGRMKLSKDKAVEAMKRRIAEPLGMDVVRAAMGVVDIIDSHMADLVRKVTVGRGYDPREFVLFAFGGAGPLHVGAYGLIEGGARLAVIPAYASEFSAFGIAVSDIVHIKMVSDPMLMPADVGRLNRIYQEMEKELTAALRRDGVKRENISLLRSMEMRYRGQVHEISTPVPGKKLTPADLNRVVDDFERRYEQKYGPGTAYKAAGILSRTYQVKGVGKIVTPALRKHKLVSESPRPALKARRPVYFKEYGKFVATNIYDRDKLKPGNSIKGPAIVEAVDTTILVKPGLRLRIDPYLNMLMEKS